MEDARMSQVIESIVPGAGVEGGEVIITCKDFVFSTYDQARVRFGGADARPVSASPTRVIAPVPSSLAVDSGEVFVTLESNGSVREGVQFLVGTQLGVNINPVRNTDT